MIDRYYPLISICIPVFNGIDYIQDSINSVLSQSYENFELLIVDNCSTDDTQSIIKAYDDERIRFESNNSNIGAINNFTKCVELAVGEYFVLLPHDDILLPGALLEFVNTMKNKNVGFVYSAMQVIDKNGNLLHKKINYPGNMLFTSEEALKDLIKNFMPIQLAMVRTDIIKKLGGFDLNYSLFSDVHLWLRVIFEGWSVYYINTPKSRLRSHDQQGQRAFQNPNLNKLSEHWGKELDEVFWEKNSYNFLLLKLSGFIFKNMYERGYKNVYAKKVFLRMFVRSHARSILLSVISLNKFTLLLELKLFDKLIKQYAVTHIIKSYLYMIINEIWIRLFKRNS